MNKLPEKLTLLRKYNQFSQTDVAEKLGVPVTDYMSWENGNCICRIDQLKELAEMFGVSVDALVDNTKTIVIPEEELMKSAQIPSFSSASSEKTQEMTAMAQAGTIQMETVSDPTQETRVISQQPLSSIEEKKEHKEENVVEEEQDETPVSRRKDAAKKNDGKKKKNTMIILGVVAVLIIAIAAFLLLMGGSHSVALSKENRLAVGDTWSMYVDQSGKINVKGDLKGASSFTEGVQVSGYGPHATALTSKGKVVDNLYSSEVSSWTRVDYVAAGKNHVVAVTDEGKVLCAGSENACKVDSWNNIEKVYAGNEITVGLTNDGQIKVAGNGEALSSVTGISDLAMSDTLAAWVKTDGTVTVSMLASADVLDTSSWVDVRNVAVGSNYVIGLTADGSILCESADEEFKTEVTGWKNIRYLAAGDQTVVAIDRSGNMYGAGDNSHNQYENQKQNTDDENNEEKQLGEVKNITVTESTANVVIKWDTVENADSYTVSISNIGDLPETKNNQASLSASSFTDGETYTITITAKPKSSSKTKESSATITYTYEAKKIQLTTPSGITASTDAKGWTIQWAAVDHADYYEISLDGSQPQRANTNSYIYDTSQIISVGNHTITIKAFSVNSTYTESEEGSGVVQYEPQLKTIPVMYIQGESTYVDSGNPTVDVYVGMDYTYQDLDSMAGGFAAASQRELSDPTGTVHIYDTTTSIQIYLKQQES